MPNKREIEESKDQCKHKIYMENPLNQRKKSQAEMVKDFSLSSILEIIEYKTKFLEKYSRLKENPKKNTIKFITSANLNARHLYKNYSY